MFQHRSVQNFKLLACSRLANKQEVIISAIIKVEKRSTIVRGLPLWYENFYSTSVQMDRFWRRHWRIRNLKLCGGLSVSSTLVVALINIDHNLSLSPRLYDMWQCPYGFPALGVHHRYSKFWSLGTFNKLTVISSVVNHFIQPVPWFYAAMDVYLFVDSPQCSRVCKSTLLGEHSFPIFLDVAAALKQEAFWKFLSLSRLNMSYFRYSFSVSHLFFRNTIYQITVSIEFWMGHCVLLSV